MREARCLLFLLVPVASCQGGKAESDEAPGQGPHSPPVLAPDEVTVSPGRALAARANNYVINYGGWDAEKIDFARGHDLVILDPNEGDVDRSLVEAIQGGVDPGDPDSRVIVLCYVSVGEDQRTAKLSDEEMAGDPRFVGDGSGPRIDPRGPDADGESLSGLDPLGLPSNGGDGWASWYLDDVSVEHGGGVGDGVPDRNPLFESYFVNAGDPAWFEELQEMTYDGPDGLTGLREILTTSHGRGLGCDGVFMDTFDTAFPNSWTDAGSRNETKFEWTAPGFSAFVHRLRAEYPDAVILLNRGLFFFNPELPHFAFNPGLDLDFVFFESYRLNSGDSDNPDPYYYPDNRFNVTPKLVGEANRPDGFRVLSLGYAEGPADQMSELTLVGESQLGFESLREDIRVTEQLAGYRHYISNSSVTLVNRFVADHADREDTSPPVWTSTYNDNDRGSPAPMEPTPRVGIQEVVPGPGQLTVRWDVALDLNRVGYALYYQKTPFDFARQGTASATRLVLRHEPGAGYVRGVGPNVYANQAAVTNLLPGETYYLLIRAFDDSPAAHEDDNQIVLTGVPQPTATYLGRWRASNGVSDLRYRFHHSEPDARERVYIDRDRLAGTGYAIAGIGADFLIEGAMLYRHAGSSSRSLWVPVRPLPMASGAADGRSFVEWHLAQDDIGAGYRRTYLVFEIAAANARQRSGVYEHIYTTSDATSPYRGHYAENDAERIHYRAEISGEPRYKHVFIDSDADAGTGYLVGGIGADYLIENGELYRHRESGWRWEHRGSAHMEVSGTEHRWWIRRADVEAGEGAPLHRIVFQANGERPGFVAPIYEHRFSP
jgi:hypothetical protein